MNSLCFIVASNNEEVLRSSLLASPDLFENAEISVQREVPAAAVAYNRGIEATNAEVMVFVHQDVYLPMGWLQKLEQTLQGLQRDDPNWGVLGLFGTERDGTGQGYLYSTGLRRILGSEFAGARRVETLDEVMLILRRASGLRFDEQLPGFHLYGADICLQAEARGMKNYAISDFAVHNTNGVRLLPRAYWTIYRQIRRKWQLRLPVCTPCMPITRWSGPAWRYLIRQRLRLALGRHQLGNRVPDPAALWRRLRDGKVISQSA